MDLVYASIRRPSKLAGVHVRRALLLFAVVLGLAALAASVSQPRREDARPRPVEGPSPTAVPAPGHPSGDDVVFSPTGRPRTNRLEVGRSVTVVVRVSRPGEVALEGLGLVAPAEPLTPARFDVLGREPGVHRVRFTPAGAASEAVTLGELAIVSD
jgi:hypothetical protein